MLVTESFNSKTTVTKLIKRLSINQLTWQGRSSETQRDKHLSSSQEWWLGENGQNVLIAIYNFQADRRSGFQSKNTILTWSEHRELIWIIWSLKCGGWWYNGNPKDRTKQLIDYAEVSPTVKRQNWKSDGNVVFSSAASDSVKSANLLWWIISSLFDTLLHLQDLGRCVWVVLSCCQIYILLLQCPSLPWLLGELSTINTNKTVWEELNRLACSQ